MDALLDTLRDHWGKLTILVVGSSLVFGLIKLFVAFMSTPHNSLSSF